MSTLPPELEMYVFKLGAVGCTIAVPSWMLVARRVHIWCVSACRMELKRQFDPHRHRLEPELYRTIIYAPSAIAGLSVIRTEAELLDLLGSRKHLFRKFTRNVFVAYHTSERGLSALLNACANLEDLKLYPRFQSWSDLPYASCTRLTHLSCSFEGLAYTHRVLQPGLPCYASLTHVSIQFAPYMCKRVKEWLQALPRLTHLALRLQQACRVADPDFLVNMPQLKCLIIEHGPYPWYPYARGRLALSDARLVTSEFRCWNDRGHDWQFGIAYGNDKWSRADEVLNSRNGDPSVVTALTESMVDWEAVRSTNDLRVWLQWELDCR
jgi:hypothetical protein